MNSDDEQGLQQLHPESSASLRKLLSSHLSIYNALTNPDLDVDLPNSPLFAGKERYTPPPLDFPVAIDPLGQFPWSHINVKADGMSDLARHALTASASPRPKSASILSITSEEDNPSDSIVVVPSLRSAAGSKVMVFETDEEDGGDDFTFVKSARSTYSVPGDDDTTLTNNHDKPKQHITVPSNLHSLFIMPKMSLSDNAKQVQLTILSSSNNALKVETQALIDFIRNNVDVSLKVQVNHLVISQSPLKFDISVMKNSDLLFLVNDGSLLFIEFMEALLRSDGDKSPSPKLTVINVMTTNYFINLFEIINSTRPHQIWKTPSLHNSKLLCKLKSYIDEELDDGNSGKHAHAFKMKSRKFSSKNRKSPCKENNRESTSVYNSLSPTRKPDYKIIEKQIRCEMLMSLNYSNIDPLQLSSNLTHLGALINAFKKYFGSSGPLPSSEENEDLTIIRRNLWLICSFSLGIGVGITVASGAVTSIGKGLTELSKNFMPSKSDLADNYKQLVAADGPAVNFASSEFAGKLLGAMEDLGGSMRNAFEAVAEGLLVITESSIVNSAIEYLTLAIQELKSISTLAMESIWGGFKKSSNILLATDW